MKPEITEIDRLGFKFLPMTLGPEFKFFLDWLMAVRTAINKAEAIVPQLKFDATRNELENIAIKAIVMRTKVAMLDDLVNLIATLQNKQKIVLEEGANGKG